MTTYTKYKSTCGRSVVMGDKQKLAKVFFGKREDNGTWDIWVESTRSGGMMGNFGKKNITVDELNNIDSDPYDDMIFDKKAFALFGLEV